MIVGATVRMTGECQHRLWGGREFDADVRNCFHTPGTVVHKFRDGVSFWVRNRHGQARRIVADNLRMG